MLGPNGERLTSRTTGKRNRDEALLVADDWARNGLPEQGGERRSILEAAGIEEALRVVREAPLTASDALRIVQELRARGLITLEVRSKSGPASEPFGAWLRAFWKYDGAYIAERLAHGQRATRRHCQDMEGRAREIEALLPPGLPLGEVKRSHLVALGLALALKAKGLASATVNKDLSAATTALRWAAANEVIPIDPTRGLRGFSGQGKRRGILEPGEVKALFSATWQDERARVACLVAMTTGARLGEVLALRREDIGEDRLFIRHSYSIRDGLKTTKSGEAREVPLLPTVRAALLTLEAKSPHKAGPERFAFAGRAPDSPLDANRILLGMRKALVSMNGKKWEDEEDRAKVLAEYSARGIDFHSWRNWYAKTMSDRLDAKAVQRATGHKTAAMLEHYADHAAEGDLARLGVATGEAFSELIA
ncbi:MAG: tyrosine-type recombinase/integrase [Rectinemataceae bacterium]